MTLRLTQASRPRAFAQFPTPGLFSFSFMTSATLHYASFFSSGESKKTGPKLERMKKINKRIKSPTQVMSISGLAG